MNYKFLFISLFSLLNFFSCTPEKTTNTSNNSSKTETSQSTTSKKEITKAEPIPEAQISKAKEIISSVSSDDVKKIEARKVFNLNCTTCHGTKGNMKMNGAKDLTISILTKEERVAKIYHGKALMTPFKGVLTDAEIVAVAEYIEKFKR